MLIRTITNFTISVSLLLLCSHAVFAGEITPLSIHDIAGTYQLDRMVDSWGNPIDTGSEQMCDGNRCVKLPNIYANRDVFVLAEDYYILGSHRVETSYELASKDIEKNIKYGDEYEGVASEFFGLFPEYSPRLFDVVFICGGILWIIEVFDFNTLVVQYQSAFMLYRRVKQKGK